MVDHHTGQKVTGRVKEAAGALTGDDGVRREGRRDQTSAAAKEKVDELADKVGDAIDAATGKGGE